MLRYEPEWRTYWKITGQRSDLLLERLQRQVYFPQMWLFVTYMLIAVVRLFSIALTDLMTTGQSVAWTIDESIMDVHRTHINPSGTSQHTHRGVLRAEGFDVEQVCGRTPIPWAFAKLGGGADSACELNFLRVFTVAFHSWLSYYRLIEWFSWLTTDPSNQKWSTSLLRSLVVPKCPSCHLNHYCMLCSSKEYNLSKLLVAY